MENENKNCEHKGGCKGALAIIAIILSVISIGISAFTLGLSIKNQKECMAKDMMQNCPMQNNNPMMGDMMGNKNNFMPMWPMGGNANRMNNFWQRNNNDNTATSSNAKRKIGGYSPYNKAYDRKPVQEIEGDQSPQEYKTFNPPDNTYGEKLKERERLRKEKRESIATRESENNN